MGIVYVATHLRLQQTRALKLIAPDLAHDDAFRRRFERESRLAASIDHAHVIPVHDAGEEDGQLYVVMRYVEGTDLGALITRQGRIEPDLATHVVGQVASALHAAHARGLVHRDVKPANILLAGDGQAPHAYLTDFGLTKLVASGSSLTASGMFVGTLDYIAPEQLAGRDLDARADVYALGCVLYHALSGQVPYPRNEAVAKMYAHTHEPPPRPSEAVPGLSPAFDEIVVTAMATSPADRFPSCESMLAALDATTSKSQPRPSQRSRSESPSKEIASHGGLSKTTEQLSGRTRLRRAREPQRSRQRFALVATTGIAALGIIAVLIFGVGGGTSDRSRTHAASNTKAHIIGAPIRVAFGPGDLAAGTGALWVRAQRSLSRVDPRSGEVSVTAGDQWMGVSQFTVRDAIASKLDTSRFVLVKGLPWITVSGSEGLVVRIDPVSGRLLGSPIRSGGTNAQGIVVAAGAIWVMNADDGTVTRIDPATLTTVGRPIRTIPGPWDAAVSGRFIWVTDYRRSTVSVIDAARPAAAVRKHNLGEKGPARAITADGSSVWVGTAEAVMRFDSRSGKLMWRSTDARLVNGLALGAGSLWVTSYPHSVSRLDPDTGRLVESPIQLRHNPGGVAYAAGKVWVTDASSNAVIRIDPGRNVP
jgi:serine/threonine-protein kinase